MHFHSELVHVIIKIPYDNVWFVLRRKSGEGAADQVKCLGSVLGCIERHEDEPKKLDRVCLVGVEKLAGEGDGKRGGKEKANPASSAAFGGGLSGGPYRPEGRGEVLTLCVPMLLVQVMLLNR
jgi:hypothetical protein